MTKIAVIGTGYVGAVVAGCLAAVGHEVVGVETDTERREALQNGVVPFYEPGLPEMISAQLDTGTLRFTDSYEQALEGTSVIFLCVGTPSLADGSPDTQYVEQAGNAIAQSVTGSVTLVTKSTVPIGSGRWLEDIIGDDRVIIASNPEFLREGTAVADFIYPDRVVLGSDDPKAIEALVEVYRPILDQSFTGGRPDHRPGLVTTNRETAEVIKYAANAFLAMKISFINEIAVLADQVGADVTQVATAIGMDHRIGSEFLGAGIGWGGSCFPKDLRALLATAQAHGIEALIAGAVVEVNERQIDIVVSKIEAHLALEGARVALLGLAFKPGTDDLRNAPSLKLARRLLDAGATVNAYDPVVAETPELAELTIERGWADAGTGADAVVVVTEWNEFLTLNLKKLADQMAGSLFIDARNSFDRSAATAAGLTYVGIGRATDH